MAMARMPPNARKTRPAQMNCFAMTLWSVEKMYFLRNDVGSGWIGWMSMSVQLPVPTPVGIGVIFAVDANAVGAHLGRPLGVVLLGEDGEGALHLVVVGAAVLGAADVVLARLLGLEP